MCTNLTFRKHTNHIPDTTVTPIMGMQQMKQLFSYTLFHTEDYAVGPLDYCSIAHIVNGWYV